MKPAGSLFLLLWICATALEAADVPVYAVHEIIFTGSNYRATDNPVRDIDLVTTWQHEKSRETLIIYGFFDGNGKGAAEGNIFKVRFCPTEQGTWILTRVVSNDRKLNGQNAGFMINASAPASHGFWIPDPESPGNRWYKRSDGSHQYITGNTMYSFLSEYFKGEPTSGNIKDDIINNSRFFKKVRIGITADRYPNPSSKPFLDDSGNPSDDGNYSHRPNPEWFSNRLDLAVSTSFEKDLIADLILNGPDTKESRSVLLAAKNNNDATPFLKYIAARYGSYPNVWICLSNEYDIKEPVYTARAITEYGKTLRAFLPYETPVSIHAVRNWTRDLNTPIPWFDHVIVQNKLKKIDQSADALKINYSIGGSRQPVINDELAYEGAGDGWSEEDVIEAFLGAFAGGGYATSGHKTAEKAGHYFSGNFKPEEHKAADNLNWFRNIVDREFTFWKMKPLDITGEKNIFAEHFDSRWRVMAWEDNEYILAANSAWECVADLPHGEWTVKLYNLISMKEEVLSKDAAGKFEFRLPGSRAVLVYFRKN